MFEYKAEMTTVITEATVSGKEPEAGQSATCFTHTTSFKNPNSAPCKYCEPCFADVYNCHSERSSDLSKVLQISAKVSIQTQVCPNVHFVMFLLHKQKLVIVDFCASFIITTANIYTGYLL